MDNANKSFSGLADIYLGPYGVPGALRKLGSVSTCDLSPTVDHKEQKNYGLGGGLMSTRDRLTAVGVKLTLQSLSVPNLILALRGTSTAIASGSVATGSDETHTVYLDALIRLRYINPSSVVVKSTDGETTYALGTDYTVTGAGVIPLSTGTMTEGDDVKIAYDYSAQQVVQALMNGAQDYVLCFNGVNEADNNNKVVVDLYRLRPAIVKTLALIGDNYADLALEGQLLFDSTQPSDVSPFFSWVYATPS
jgi:hypothetical protein